MYIFVQVKIHFHRLVLVARMQFLACRQITAGTRISRNSKTIPLKYNFVQVKLHFHHLVLVARLQFLACRLITAGTETSNS